MDEETRHRYRLQLCQLHMGTAQKSLERILSLVEDSPHFDEIDNEICQMFYHTMAAIFGEDAPKPPPVMSHE